MYIFGSLLVSIIISLIFYILNPKEYKWWELVLCFIFSLLLIIGSKLIIDYSSVRHTEYWGQTIVEIYEEEPWNEWVSKTCSREYACGTDSDGRTTYCTEYYDCSYQEDYGPIWYCITDNNKVFNMSEQLYDSLVVVFNTGRNILNTRRNHSSSSRSYNSRSTKFDGTRVGQTSNVYRTSWDKKDENRNGVFTTHSYVNKIKSSDLSLFNISVVEESLADSLGLYKYPTNIDIYECPVFLGGNIPEHIHNKYRRLNAKFGTSNQLRLWILIYDNQPMSVATYQENYWVKGNKNELVICIGTQEDRIVWSHSFSWSLSNTLTAEVKQKLLNLYVYDTIKNTNNLPPLLNSINTANNNVDLKKSEYPILNEQTLIEYYEYLDNNLHRFERRSFEEFDYIKVNPKKSHIIIVYVLSILFTLGINLYFSNNNIRD